MGGPCPGAAGPEVGSRGGWVRDRLGPAGFLDSLLMSGRNPGRGPAKLITAPYLFCVKFVHTDLSASVCLSVCTLTGGGKAVSSILSQFGSILLPQSGYRLARL